MKRDNIYISKYDWLCRIYLNADRSNANEILSNLREFGCNDDDISQAYDNLMSNDSNNGITYSNTSDRLSVIVIGKTTSARQFLNSLVHEIMHLSIRIASSEGLDLQGEELCYIAGDLAMVLYPLCKDYLCCKCH